MFSKTAEAIKLAYPALGLIRKDAPEPDARLLKKRTSLKGPWGCSMTLIMDAFINKRAVAFTPETCRCPGASKGFGFPAELSTPFPGGYNAFIHFIGQGNKDTEEGRKTLEELRAAGASERVLCEFANGEGYKKDVKASIEFAKGMPVLPPNRGCVMVKPLERFTEAPEVVIFLVDADQLSALTVLANYARPDTLSVIMPFSAGCFSLAVNPLMELESPRPRAIVGLTDISARLVMKRLLKGKYMSFSMPYPLYTEMEENVEESFLSRHAWRDLAGTG
jgi:uncharacterized protein (DUF169 family)